MKKNEIDQNILSDDQRKAFKIISSPNHRQIFLTGQAGSGKSFLIDYIRANMRRVVVCATTGAAAQLIRGRTLHSWAGIHPRFGVVTSKKANARVRACDTLIIDEISMANTKLLDQLYDRFDMAGKTPKIVIVGDFMQLPPVDGASLFDHPCWSNFTILRLTRQHRQKDLEFIDVLNDIRVGNLTERALKLLASRTFDELPEDCTRLMAHRETVEAYNLEKIGQLPGRLCESVWSVRMENGDDPPDNLAAKSRFVDRLMLKVDARVVLLTNDQQGRWVNGSTGSVSKIEQGTVEVDLDAGNRVSVHREADEILDADGNVICTIQQYPIRLGFSLTIHRSQGMSMDRVGIDLNNHFAAGQTYVAISRCRTAEGLFLKGKIDRLIINERAMEI